MIPDQLVAAAAKALAAEEGYADGWEGYTGDALLALQAAFGEMREQCAGCGCEKQFHTGSRCGVCMDFCPYRSAWVLKARART